jgi:hypothetical protein
VIYGLPFASRQNGLVEFNFKIAPGLMRLEEEPAGSSRLPSSASADQPPPPSARTSSWVLFGDENLGLEILL